MWFSASFKFFVPFALLMSLGSHLYWESAAKIAAPAVATAMVQITQPFPEAVSFVHSTPRGADWTLVALFAFWACGFGTISLIRVRGWLRIWAAVRASSSLELPVPVEVRSSSGLLEPGIVGWLRPILLLPEGIQDRLSPLQLEAVLAHELCHVRRRDNLFASIHMIVEAIFWFHPLVWWIGARLVEERERACDEEVLSLVSESRVYAEGILNVCKLYIESPLVCVSGVTGANLRRRIEAIMTNRKGQQLNRAKKFLLASAGVAALAIPLTIGVGNPPAIRAQSPAAPSPQFDVASIKPNNSGANPSSVRVAPGGRLTAFNASLRSFITQAYQIPDFELSGGPAWMNSDRYDIEARGPATATPEQIMQMLQALLADRFQLKIHRETRELPVYALLIGKNGSKLEPSRGGDCWDPTAGIPPPTPDARPCGGFRNAPNEMSGVKVPMYRFVLNLSRFLGRTVIDKTGLGGAYDITLKWTPDESQAFLAPAGQPPSDSSGPSIFTAVQEQLGLRLESQKGPVEVLVIDHVEKPSEN